MATSPRHVTAASEKPHLGPEDFYEGPQAAERFRAAVAIIASLPKSAVPPHQPTKRSKSKKK